MEFMNFNVNFNECQTVGGELKLGGASSDKGKAVEEDDEDEFDEEEDEDSTEGQTKTKKLKVSNFGTLVCLMRDVL